VTRILLVDDHAVVRRGLRIFLDLQEGLEVVGEAADGAQAVEEAERLAPDVVLMDVVMPGVDGIAATARLRERVPDARVLVLSSFDDSDRVLPALKAGAAGYLMKDTQPDALAEAIRAVERGEPVLASEAMERVLADFRHPHRPPEGTVTVAFTDIEGSTALLEELGEEEARRRFRGHDDLVCRVARENGGVVVEQEGDSFMVAFASARRAVLWAIELQRALAAAGCPRVRIGLNTGEVVAEGDRYFGRAVFVASRVAGRGKGGQILVSEVTRMLAGDEDGLRFHDAGEHLLKGLHGRHRLYEVEW
jgi:DNA-binding NarL/FixJ family response regulator